MKREDIEKRSRIAREKVINELQYGYSKHHDINRYTIASATIGKYGLQLFVEGATWRINSVWHTMDKVQDGKRPYVVQFVEGGKFAMFTKPIPVPFEQAKTVFRRWAYIEDLLPEED